MTCYYESEYVEVAGRVWKCGWFTGCCCPERDGYKFYMCKVDNNKSIEKKEDCPYYLEEYICLSDLFK